MFSPLISNQMRGLVWDENWCKIFYFVNDSFYFCWLFDEEFFISQFLFVAYPQTQTVPNVKTNVGTSNTGATIHVVNSNINAGANTIRHKSEYFFKSFQSFPTECMNFIFRCPSTTYSTTIPAATSYSTAECTNKYG